MQAVGPRERCRRNSERQDGTLENASHFSALEQPVEMARILIGAAGIRAGAGFETAETGPRGRRGTERKAEDYHSPVGKALRHGSPTRLPEDPKA
jgi:hypothetical protein